MAPGFNMYDLVVGDIISGQIALNGYYELGLSKKICADAGKVGLFVDVGANLGYFSLLWLHGHPDNRVVAIEASPRNQEKIRVNFARNAIEDRALLFCNAAGNEEKKVQFILGPQEQTGWGGIVTESGHGQAIEVNMIRLDRIVREHIHVLKIDVEGADALVLQGSEGLLKARMIDKIYFEQNSERMARLGIKANDAIEFLRDYGYCCRPLDAGGQQWEANPDS